MAANSFLGEAPSVNEEEEEFKPRGKNLKLWGNQVTMNINPMIHTNIIQSPYFKTNLIELKTYHEVIDEIYYKVSGVIFSEFAIRLRIWNHGNVTVADLVGKQECVVA